MPEEPQHKLRDGVAVTIGETPYIIAPFSLNTLRQAAPIFKKMEQVGITAESLDDWQIEGFIKLIHAALIRNYPNLTLEWVGDNVEPGQLAEIMSAIIEVNGFTKGESPPGEAPEPVT
jgi:hypothetical protein